MQFSPDAPPVDAGISMLTNTMALDGLTRFSEIKEIPAPGMEHPGRFKNLQATIV